MAKELTLSVLEDVSRRKFDEAYPTRRLEVLKAPRRIYRLPPLPPTSPTLDDSMTRWPDSVIRCWLAGLRWLLSSGWLLSSIHRFIGSGGWFMDFHEISEISWISGDFMDFHRFRGPRPRTFAAEMMPLKKPLLDPS